MKKSIMLLFLFGILFSVNAQVVMTKDSFPCFQSVYKVEGSNSNQIHTLLKTWIAINYKSAKDVIQLDDPENGKIIMKGTSDFYYTIYLSQIPCTCRYIITFDIKDNKFRASMEISDITASYRYGDSSILSHISPNSKSAWTKSVYSSVIKIKENIFELLLNVKPEKKEDW